MRAIIICLLATFISSATFSQKVKQNTDSIKSYLAYSCSVHPQYVSNTPANCPVCSNNMTLSKKEQMKAEVVKLYTCPMDKVYSKQPGKCPRCNMDMLEFKPKKASEAN